MSNDRIRKVKAKMTELGLDGFLIGANENKFYLAGFSDMSQYTGVDSFLLLTKGADYLIVEYADDERAARAAPDCTVLAVADKESLGETVCGITKKEGIQKLGFEGNVLKYAYYADIQEKTASKVELSPVGGLLEEMRSIKDADEIVRIEKAIEIGDAVFAHILPMIRVGAVEKDLAWEIEAYARKELGAEGLAFTTIVASGANSALPHGLATDKVIEKGDFVTFDFGLKYNGYCGDMTRTVVMGPPSEKQLEIYSIVAEAQLAGVKAARAGMLAKDLDKVARDRIGGYGYGREFGHELGHSMGVRCHEIPMVGDYDSTVLMPGMIVTVEPGIYIPGWGGVRIEDTVLIEEGGCRILTKTTKELLVL